MSFYIDLLCETAPLKSGAIAPHLLASSLIGFDLGSRRSSFIPCTADTSRGIALNPKDGPDEVVGAIGGLSRLELGSRVAADRTIEFVTALERYCRTLGSAYPGVLAGYWRWLTGPDGNKRTRRLERILFDSVDELCRHKSKYNRILLVRCTA